MKEMRIKIGSKTVGEPGSCFVIAEAGVNHNGSLELAMKLIDIAVEAKADAVKFQTFKARILLQKMHLKLATILRQQAVVSLGMSY